MSAAAVSRRLFSHISSKASVYAAARAEPYDPVQLGHMKETCIAVNERDEVVGSISKRNAHEQPGLVLHRAFSVFAFTPDAKLILQKRSDAKITFPTLWTNTCCSHPLHNEREMNGEEGVKRAAIRKLQHEMGIEGVRDEDCQVVGRYLYKAEMSSSPWGEHELDYAVVLRNIGAERLRPNAEEVSDVRMVTEREVRRWVDRAPQEFSPWFSLFVGFSHLSNWWTRLDALSSVRNMDIVRLN